MAKNISSYYCKWPKETFQPYIKRAARKRGNIVTFKCTSSYTCNLLNLAFSGGLNLYLFNSHNDMFNNLPIG